MAVSPDATLKKVNHFGAGFDMRVIEWKNDVSHYFKGKS